jgi:hypothetical protein
MKNLVDVGAWLDFLLNFSKTMKVEEVAPCFAKGMAQLPGVTNITAHTNDQKGQWIFFSF